MNEEDVMRYLRRLALALGSLWVAGAAQASGAVSPMDLVQPISEYKAYVAGEVTVLVAETEKFAAAVKAGDLKAAQKLYGSARSIIFRACCGLRGILAAAVGTQSTTVHPGKRTGRLFLTPDPRAAIRYR
jgi:hypothetical protein